MSEKVLLVSHMPGPRSDRVHQLLLAAGEQVEWCPIHAGAELPEPDGAYKGAIVYGGAQSANDDETHDYIGKELRWIERWVGAGKPYFGICLGAQTLARALGAQVKRHPERHWEIGYVPIVATEAGRAFLPENLHVYHWHNEGFDVPEGGELLASGPVFPNQAFRYGEHAFGIQFHPEVTPIIMSRWMSEAAHCLEEPGAQAMTRQFSDANRHHEPLGDWLRGFMDHWLAL